MGNFLDMTIVCLDCIPAGARARAGMAVESQVSWQLPICGENIVFHWQ